MSSENLARGPTTSLDYDADARECAEYRISAGEVSNMVAYSDKACNITVNSRYREHFQTRLGL